MKQNLLRVATLGALAAGMIFAQSESGSGQLAKRSEQRQGWRNGGPAQHRAHFAQRMANYLNLTPQQRDQAKQIMASAREQAKPVRQQLKANREALMNAIKTGNDAQIDQITQAQAPLIAQASAIRAHAFEKIYATLTPEQKAKADNMRQLFHSRRMHQGQQPQNS
jgi:Spy/CpxP family protein refolding chaperone